MRIKWLAFLGAVLCYTSTNAKHKLKKGDDAPNFVVTTVYGDTVNLNSLHGNKVLITFNRYVSCPLCNFRMHELLQHFDSLTVKGLVFISIYESTPEQLKEYTQQEDVPFKMLADPQLHLYNLYGVERSNWKTIKGFLRGDYRSIHHSGRAAFKNDYDRDGHLNRIGADFLIDENGKIVQAYYGKHVGDHYPVGEILKWVYEVQ